MLSMWNILNLPLNFLFENAKPILPYFLFLIFFLKYTMSFFSFLAYPCHAQLIATINIFISGQNRKKSS